MLDDGSDVAPAARDGPGRRSTIWTWHSWPRWGCGPTRSRDDCPAASDVQRPRRDNRGGHRGRSGRSTRGQSQTARSSVSASCARSFCSSDGPAPDAGASTDKFDRIDANFGLVNQVVAASALSLHSPDLNSRWPGNTHSAHKAFGRPCGPVVVRSSVRAGGHRSGALRAPRNPVVLPAVVGEH